MGYRKIGVGLPAEAETLLFITMSRPALVSTSLLSNKYREIFPQKQSGQRVKLTTRLHLVPRVKVRGALSPLTLYVFMAWCIIGLWENFQYWCLSNLPLIVSFNLWNVIR
jgi:hypothetical protein